MGSGSTALAARREGRRCVGYEISAEYCELAKARLKELEGTEETDGSEGKERE